MAGLIPFANRAAYGCSKAALSMYVGVLQQECPSLDITCVHPGMVDTPPVHVEFESDVIRKNSMSPAELARIVVRESKLYAPVSGWIAHLWFVFSPGSFRKLIPMFLPKTRMNRMSLANENQ